MKLRIRYTKKADVPAQFAQFYSPVDENDPDGVQMFSAFEPDPDGFALVNASKTQAELAKIQRDKQRQDATLAKFRKPNSTDLWTPEDIERLVQAEARLAELDGKTPDLDAIRKQVAADVSKEWTGKVTTAQQQLEAERKAAQAYRDMLRDTIRTNTATAALGDLRPKKGLAELAIERFAREIDLEEQAVEGSAVPRFVPRVRGPNGYRVDANGMPIDPKVFAKTEFLRSYGELFEPTDSRNGTGAAGSGGGGGNNPRQGSKSSGRFTMTQDEMLRDTGAYRDRLRAVPATDALQITDQDGNVVREIPGQAK